MSLCPYLFFLEDKAKDTSKEVRKKTDPEKALKEAKEKLAFFGILFY
jgi:hypothetical protein